MSEEYVMNVFPDGGVVKHGAKSDKVLFGKMDEDALKRFLDNIVYHGLKPDADVQTRYKQVLRYFANYYRNGMEVSGFVYSGSRTDGDGMVRGGRCVEKNPPVKIDEKYLAKLGRLAAESSFATAMAYFPRPPKAKKQSKVNARKGNKKSEN